MNSTAPTLFASPETVSAVRRARAIIALVGGYDGSGNFGDIAQCDAALELVSRLGPGALVLHVLERQYLASHREFVGSTDEFAFHPLFFDPDDVCEDDLIPVGAPHGLAFGGFYLYGGGYLNRLWGARKIAMLSAAEALLSAGGAPPSSRLASGLQVEPEWVDGGSGSVLENFELLGGRDTGSCRALAALDSTVQPTETGDDAIGLLGRLPIADTSPAGGDRLHINLHFAEHDWVSDRPSVLLDFYAGFVAELGKLADMPVSAQPLLAYLDHRVDERPASERLRETCRGRGIEVAEPLLLRPADLAGMVPRLRQASITVSCSYHVALTSLMLGVPALLIGDNPFYEQKAAGLHQDFGLPEAFGTTSIEDPLASAAALAPFLLEAQATAEFHAVLAAAADRQRQRRMAIELELLGRLGEAAVAALGNRVGEQIERLALRSAEPAALQVRIAGFQTELEELATLSTNLPPNAELRIQMAEARAVEAQATLDSIVQSRSWRLAAPLRWAGALRRRGARSPDGP